MFFCSAVPGHIRTCSLLLFGGGCVLPAQPELWDHQKVRVSRSTDRRTLHEAICQGRLIAGVSCSSFLTFKFQSKKKNKVKHSLCVFCRPSAMFFCPMLISFPSCLPTMLPWRKWYVINWACIKYLFLFYIGKQFVLPTQMNRFVFKDLSSDTYKLLFSALHSDQQHPTTEGSVGENVWSHGWKRRE